MSNLEIILLGVALAMDAFAVSVTEGLKMERVRYKEAITIALFFGAFQSLMPLLGWRLGTAVSAKIDAFDHWVGFILLTMIGINSLREALKKDPDPYSDILEEGKIDEADPEDPLEKIEREVKEYRLNIPELFVLAIATSIDALAVGVTFALNYSINVVQAVLMIGAVTFLICCSGVALGRNIGTKFRKKAEVAGGLILIAIGVRILLDGLGIFL